MATTQAGWPVIFDSDSRYLRRWVIPGTGREYTLRDGSAGFVIVWFILWWHHTIEKIDRGVWDEWGWAVRPVRGQSTGYSNHAGGVAADVNSTLHPMGTSIWSNFLKWQVVKIRWVIRVRLRHALEWGGEWDRPDGMHIEINCQMPKAERVAKRLMKTHRGQAILKANPGAKQVILS